MRWAGHVEGVGMNGNTDMVLAGKPERKRALGIT
jgi:hypothetical protein